jgi:elongation factor P--beta-lysine ligase
VQKGADFAQRRPILCHVGTAEEGIPGRAWHNLGHAHGDGELCNGYGELTDPAEQQARMQREVASRVAQGQPELPIDQWFLASLREGLASCSGNALGFDRLVMLASGADSVADVIGFPWERN